MTTEMLTPEAVLAAFARHLGEANGISAHDLAIALCGMFYQQADERRLRGVIEQLRRDGHPICGTPETGYFHATSQEELDRTSEFLYRRAMTSLSQIAAMRRVATPDLRGQLRLPELPHPLGTTPTPSSQEQESSDGP